MDRPRAMVLAVPSPDIRDLCSPIIPMNRRRTKSIPGNTKSALLIALTSTLLVSTFDLKAKAQMGSPECAGFSLGALIGQLINPRSNASAAIPEHCRGIQQPREGYASPAESKQVDLNQIKIRKSNREIMMEVERVGPYRGTLLQDTY
jgi:hypothetical protein